MADVGILSPREEKAQRPDPHQNQDPGGLGPGSVEVCALTVLSRVDVEMREDVLDISQDVGVKSLPWTRGDAFSRVPTMTGSSRNVFRMRERRPPNVFIPLQSLFRLRIRSSKESKMAPNATSSLNAANFHTLDLKQNKTKGY